MTTHSTLGKFVTVMVLVHAFTMSAYSDEPNEDFNSATILAPGVLSVLDALTASGPLNPDTILGNRDPFGSIEFTDDDSSPIGDGLGSALYEVPTNSGSIDFAVSGYDDFDFVGEHSESGDYEVFVDVYDFSDELIASFSSGTQVLAVGIVDDYSYFDSTWTGGSYDVYINNGQPIITDIDFFTFTGLTPGMSFGARTTDPDGLEIDTLLGWFNSLGELVEVDDDDGGGYMSLIEGVVPEEGQLTFAVTGYGDDEFVGQHSESGAYGLILEINRGTLHGDYNGDGFVDAADYTVWRNNLNDPTEAIINNNGDGGGVSESDYTWWKQHYGNSSAGIGEGGLVQNSVPEPPPLVLLMLAAVTWCVRRGPASSKSQTLIHARCGATNDRFSG